MFRAKKRKSKSFRAKKVKEEKAKKKVYAKKQRTHDGLTYTSNNANWDFTGGAGVRISFDEFRNQYGFNVTDYDKWNDLMPLHEDIRNLMDDLEIGDFVHHRESGFPMMVVKKLKNKIRFDYTRRKMLHKHVNDMSTSGSSNFKNYKLWEVDLSQMGPTKEYSTTNKKRINIAFLPESLEWAVTDGYNQAYS